MIDKDIAKIPIKIFADGASTPDILRMGLRPWIRGFTTNPSLMRKAGVADYRAFAKDVLSAVKDLPISFEVVSDEPDEIEREAVEIASWAPNVYVKIPVTNTRGEPLNFLFHKLSREGVKLNVTAVLPLDQVRDAAAALDDGAPAVISVFAGRIADTGRDPVPHMMAAKELLRPYPHIELLWASPREVLNIFQAAAIGCDIITVTGDLLDKLAIVGKDLHEYSLDTVKMFFGDARKSGLTLGRAVRRP